MQIIYFALTILALVVLFGGMHVRMSAIESQIRAIHDRLDNHRLMNGRSDADE
jgi:hypothetical protein